MDVNHELLQELVMDVNHVWVSITLASETKQSERADKILQPAPIVLRVSVSPRSMVLTHVNAGPRQ